MTMVKPGGNLSRGVAKVGGGRSILISMKMKRKMVWAAKPRFHWAVVVTVLAALWMSGDAGPAAAEGPAADAHTVPSVDGGIGPCSVAFIIRDGAGAPVYNAKVRVHIAYGFLSAHKLDLEVGTNIDGKARFDGLPSRVKQTLHFEASQGGREGEASYDPLEGCRAERSITLAKANSDPDKP
jgi:hypothetical protein